MFEYWHIREFLATQTKACTNIRPQNCVQTAEWNTLLIPWIPYKTHRKEKGKIPGQHACYSNEKQTTAMSTFSFHFKEVFVKFI